MAETGKERRPVAREVWKRDAAVTFFESIGEKYRRDHFLDPRRSGHLLVS